MTDNQITQLNMWKKIWSLDFELYWNENPWNVVKRWRIVGIVGSPIQIDRCINKYGQHNGLISEIVIHFVHP